MAKLLRTSPEAGVPRFMFWCPGCECAHWFKTDGVTPTWTWNENFKSPSVQPSINMFAHINKAEPPKICHLYLENGAIRYLPDTTHKYSGQTIEMLDWADVLKDEPYSDEAA